MFYIDIVILTKSSKQKGFCVAGINLLTHEWVRLVSPSQEHDGALSINELCLPNGYILQPLDIARVPILKYYPQGCQSENYLIASETPWEYLGKMALSDVIKKSNVLHPPLIFGNKYKYIKSDMIDMFNRSLLLTEVTDLKIYRKEGTTVRHKCEFKHNGNLYEEISMTDPDYYRYNTYDIKKAYIVVSLPHKDFPEGRYYKFVAKIFPCR